MSRRYLVKGNQHRKRGKNAVQLATEMAVVFARKSRATGRSLGGFQEIEDAGTWRDRLNLVVREGIDGFGHDASGRRYRVDYVPTTAAEVKKVVRVLRDQEAEEIDRLRERLRELYEQIDVVQGELDEALRVAFTRGNVVRVAELVEVAEAREKTG